MEDKLGMITITTPRCIECHQYGKVVVQFSDYLKFDRPDRPLIQDCFPSLSRELREQILTGTHPECWEKMFPPEEEEEEDIPDDERGPWSSEEEIRSADHPDSLAYEDVPWGEIHQHEVS